VKLHCCWFLSVDAIWIVLYLSICVMLWSRCAAVWWSIPFVLAAWRFLAPAVCAAAARASVSTHILPALPSTLRYAWKVLNIAVGVGAAGAAALTRFLRSLLRACWHLTASSALGCYTATIWCHRLRLPSPRGSAPHLCRCSRFIAG